MEADNKENCEDFSTYLGDQDENDETAVDIEQPFVLLGGSATTKEGDQTDYHSWTNNIGGEIYWEIEILPRTITEMDRLL